MNHIRLAKNDDEEEILKLYRSLVGTKNCAWTLEYPSVEDIRRDVAMDSLYCLCDETDQIIATASASCDDELTGLNWNENMKNPCELARVGVNPLLHNQGLGREIVAYVTEDAKRRGFDGIRMLVSKTNLQALALYEKLGFHRCGEASMYDMEWFCYEMVL